MRREQLHTYQNTTVNHIINNNHAGVFLEMGLGKTVSSLTAVNDLIYSYLEVNRVLIVAPKRVAESVWHTEVAKWDHLKHLRVSRVIGTDKQRRKALNQEADIYTIGRDNIDWLCALYGGGMLPFDMLIIDESSSFKNPSSKRFKALKRVQPSFSRVVILTGTPSPNGLMDLWAQIYLLDRGTRLGKFITSFREKYFYPKASNGHIVYKYGTKEAAEERIYDAISDICISMSAKDYLQLPERINNVIEIDMPEKLSQAYKEFEREKVLELYQQEDSEQETGLIAAANAAALSNKLLQFANGAIYDEDKRVEQVHRLKLDALKELIEDANGEPTLIAYAFQHDRDNIMQALKKYKPVQLKTEEHIEQWNKGEIEVMIMHPASGGHGLNLQGGGRRIVWFGQTWSLELLQQFDARLHRQGQTKPVIITKLITKGTIDSRVLEAQEKKASGQAALMEAVKALKDEYLGKRQK